MHWHVCHQWWSGDQPSVETTHIWYSRGDEILMAAWFEGTKQGCLMISATALIGTLSCQTR